MKESTPEHSKGTISNKTQEDDDESSTRIAPSPGSGLQYADSRTTMGESSTAGEEMATPHVAPPYMSSPSHSYSALPPLASSMNPYMFATFDYSARPLLPFPDSGGPDQAYFTGFKADGRGYPTPPPPFPGPYPYGITYAPNDKQLSAYAHMPCPPAAPGPPQEDSQALEDTYPATSRHLQQLLPPPTMQAMPFPLFPPPPPPPGQYYSGFVQPQSSLPPLTIDDQPMQDKAMDMSINEDAGSSFSANASPAPSAMLSPQTSKLLQSAIESEGESIMALSPGTEHYQDEVEGAIQDRFTVSEIERNTEDLSRYEVAVKRVPTSSVEARASSTIPANIQADKVPLPPSYQHEDYSHFDLPSCQFANSTATMRIQNQDDSESDDDDSQTDDDEEDEDTDSDTSSNLEDKDDNDMETNSNKSDSYELDLDEDVPRVDSPFTRIRPSLLKSFRASKNYLEKLQQKKTRKLELMSPLSPFDEMSPKQVDQSPAATALKQDVKIQTSEMESGIGESSSEEEESEPPTPFTPSSASVAATPKPQGEVAQRLGEMEECEQVLSVQSEARVVDEQMVEGKDMLQGETAGDDVRFTLLQPRQGEEIYENKVASLKNSNTIPENIQGSTESAMYVDHSDMALDAEYLLPFNDANIKEILPYHSNSEVVNSVRTPYEYREVTSSVGNLQNKTLVSDELHLKTVTDYQSDQQVIVTTNASEKQTDFASKPVISNSTMCELPGSEVVTVTSQSVTSQSQIVPATNGMTPTVTTPVITQSSIASLDVVPPTDASRVLLPIKQLNDGSFAIVIKPFAKGVAQMTTAKSILKPIRRDQNPTITTADALPTSKSQTDSVVTSQNNTGANSLLMSQHGQNVSVASADCPKVTVVKTIDREGTTFGKLALERKDTPSKDQNKKSYVTEKQKRLIKILPKRPLITSGPTLTCTERESVMLEQPVMDGPAITQGFYCVDCNKTYPAGCVEHVTTYRRIEDACDVTRARSSLPDQLALRTMYNRNSPDFMGVIAKVQVACKTQFGPLQGLRTTRDELQNPENTAYVWEIFDEKQPNMVLDCRDEQHANWLMFVKRARSSVEQNMTVYQEGEHIYFITVKDIQPNTELLYWYATDYARMLGVGIKPEEHFRCSCCHREFPDMQTLRTHLRSAHPNLARCTHKCAICHKLFLTASKLAAHQEVHSGAKNYECEHCGTRFNNRSNLNRHVKLHSDKARQFTCEVCGNKFSQKTHLSNHVVIHTESRDHHCRFCDKSFRRRNDRLAHEQEVHYLGSAHACTHAGCDKVFYKLDNLKKHLLTHSGERKFKCDVCGTAFVQKAHLKTHLFKIHERVMTHERPNRIRQGVT